MTARGTLVVTSHQEIPITAEKTWSLKIFLTWYRRLLSQKQVTEHTLTSLYLQMHSILTLLELKDQIGEEENYSQMQPKVKCLNLKDCTLKFLSVTFPSIVNNLYIYYFKSYMLIFHLPVLKKLSYKSVCAT